MSRIGKLPIAIPKGVEVKLDATNINVKGPKGSLDVALHPDITVKVEDGNIVCTRPTDRPEHRSLHGLMRALINNAVTGVTAGFEKKLNIIGVGYRCEMAGKNLKLIVGYSNDVIIEPLEGITFECGIEGPQRTPFIFVRGISKETVGQQAALIRRVRPPEPYKGKGIRYAGEYVRRKVGKAAVKK
ncbi:MAG: 50S ribosomal protein L6 [Abditibacteriota bacterium]|nr:50S ribosomal protein L6 [Abditibacteriota bacterium]